MGADSSDYNTLRSTLISLATENSSDLVFARIARNLSIKCLVQQKNYIAAIDAYEDVIANSTDSAEINAAEISVIELYVLVGSMEGDAHSFTGRYAQLKPTGLRDAMRKIRQKMGHNVSQNISEGNIPNQFNLSQNYPNPFNPLTKINYSIPKGTNVSIRIYDILGRLVRTLVNEFREAGTYNINFDGSNLSSGVYFYRIEAGDFVESKKMVLIK